MAINTILIGNANTFLLNDFRNALTGALESDVEAYLSICERPPTGAKWLVEGASNGVGPIVITSTNHQLADGDKITIVDVGDQRGAHGTFPVTVIDANSFSLDGSVGIADWTNGGVFFRCIQDAEQIAFTLSGAGQYQATIDGELGLIDGQQYTIVVYCLGTYRDLYNEIDRVTARIRGNQTQF